MNNLKILIVDDFQMIRGMVKKILTELGYTNFDEAENGLIALTKVKLAQKENIPFDLIFSDWNMPEMSGFEFLEECRKTPELSSVFFIMITAEAEDDKMIKALKAGANDYIIKPISSEVLGKKIDLIIKKINKK